MGPFADIRIGEQDLRADFEAGADRFGERIGRLDRHVEARSSSSSAAWKSTDICGSRATARRYAFLQSHRKLDGDYVRTRAQAERGELRPQTPFCPAHRKIAKPAAVEASRVRAAIGSTPRACTAALPRPRSR